MNSKRFKIACGLVQNITVSAVVFSMQGIIKDVKANTFPDYERLIPAWGRDGLIGSIKAIKNWDTNPMILDHLAACVLGRMGQFILADNGFSPMEMTPDQIVTFTNSTDALQAKVVKHFIGKEKYDAYKLLEAEATDEQKATFAALMQVFAVLSEPEEPVNKPTMH